jgi:predicted nuclease with RNAse H fold
VMAMNVKLENEADIWADDRLGFAEIGQSFTNIIQTIDDSKVISIEAPFGYGKTFFRERWSKQLKAAGELVIEIDALHQIIQAIHLSRLLARCYLPSLALANQSNNLQKRNCRSGEAF